MFAEKISLVLLLLKWIQFSSGQSVCTTKVCQAESANIQSKIDKSISPCDDFYQFACGQYNPDIPSEKSEISQFSVLQDKLEEQLNLTMGEELNENDTNPLKLVKNFFQACMNTGLKIEKIIL